MSKLTHVSILAIAVFSFSSGVAQEAVAEKTTSIPKVVEFAAVSAPVAAQENTATPRVTTQQLTNEQTSSLPEPTIADVSSTTNVPQASQNIMPAENHNVMVQEAPVQESLESSSLPHQSSELEASAEEPIGIDTIHLQEPQGNWLFKRIWWERAQERYEKIRVLVDQIWELRVGFFLNRSEIDRTKLDPFYIFIGFEQGVVQQELNELIEKLTQEEQAAGALDTEEKSLLLEIQDQKKTLENLRADIELITQFDHSIDDALERLMEQINRVRVYERDAWNSFKEIAQVLSDTKARELYYKMDTSWRNIKDIYKYLQNDFLAHFQDIINKLNAEIGRVRNVVEVLKEKGFDLKKQSELLKESLNQPVQVAVEEDEDDQEESAPKKGFFASIGSTILDGVSLFWSTITAPFSYLYHKIVD